MHQSKLALILRWEEMKACIYVYQAQGWPNQTANCKTRKALRTILWLYLFRMLSGGLFYLMSYFGRFLWLLLVLRPID
jgi:hypothetical protein